MRSNPVLRRFLAALIASAALVGLVRLALTLASRFGHRGEPVGEGAVRPGTPGVRHVSRRSRNVELARLGGRVGRTYASTGARKLFASAERSAAIDQERELRTAGTSPPAWER